MSDPSETSPLSPVDSAVLAAITAGIKRTNTGSVATPKGVVYTEIGGRLVVMLAILGIYFFVVSKGIALAHDVKDVEVMMALFLSPLAGLIGAGAVYFFGPRKMPTIL